MGLLGWIGLGGGDGKQSDRLTGVVGDGVPVPVTAPSLKLHARNPTTASPCLGDHFCGTLGGLTLPFHVLGVLCSCGWCFNE